MAETPFEQDELADATYCTVVLTVLPLVGEETETLATAMVPELSISRRAKFLIRGIPVVEYRNGLYSLLWMDYPEYYLDRGFHSSSIIWKK
jgi:hypothetical protein